MATFSNYYKTPTDPTIYGIAEGGQRVAFQTPEQFYASGGAQDFSNVITDATFNPAGSILYTDYLKTLSQPTSTISPTTTQPITSPTIAPTIQPAISSSLPGESPEQLVQRIGTQTASTTQNLASSGVSGGEQTFTGFFKQPDDPTVYGVLSGGQRIAFETPEQFFAAGGATDFSNVQTDASFNPAGSITYSQYQSGGQTAPITSPTAPTATAPTSPTGTQPAATAPSYTPPVVTSEALRVKRQAEIDRIKAELNAGLTAPPLYKSLEEFTKLRTEQGIVKDEEELAALRNEALTGREELRQFRATSAQGLTQAGFLGGVSEAERNLNFRLEGLAIREQAILARLNSKNTYISNMLKFGEQDYNTARAEYEFEFNKNLKAITLYNAELAQEKQDAMTAFTTIANLLKGKGLDLDPALQTQLDTLAMQAGLPSGIFQAIMTDTTEEKIDNMKIIGNNVYTWTTDANGEPHLKLVQTVAPSVDQEFIQKAAIEAGVSTPFVTINGTTYRVADGKAYATPEEFFADGGSQDFSNAPEISGKLYQEGLPKWRMDGDGDGTGLAKDYFTNTQLAKGAAAAGMSLEQFGNLDVNTANSYINPDEATQRLTEPQILARQKYIDEQLETEGRDAIERLRSEIDNSNMTQEDKEMLKRYIELKAPAEGGFWSNLWNAIKPQ